MGLNLTNISKYDEQKSVKKTETIDKNYYRSEFGNRIVNWSPTSHSSSLQGNTMRPGGRTQVKSVMVMVFKEQTKDVPDC